LGLELLSTPNRLLAVVAATCIFVLILMRLIRRRRAAKISPTSNALVHQDNVRADFDSPLSAAQLATTIENENPVEAEQKPGLVQNQVLAELAVISRISDIMSKSSETSETRQQSRAILSAAEKARRLIQNEIMLENPDLYTPNFKPLSVNFPVFISTLAKKWAFILKSEDVTFTCHLDKSIPDSLFVDPAILTRSLETLLSNSQALTRKGRIHLHITGTEKARHDWDLTMIVADTGQGLHKSFKDKIRSGEPNLEPANTEELNIIAVRDLARQINGDLDLKSVEGRGTEASLKIKVRAAASEAPAKDNKPIPKTGKLTGRRVLIIEDDISSQEVLKTFLQPEGCEIDAILDGDQALKTLKSKSYDLVLMDVRMDGMDGIKTTQAIRSSAEDFNQIPIIAITADVNPDTNAKCMMAGANLFLNKPIGSKALFNGIQFVMDLESIDPKKTAAE